MARTLRKTEKPLHWNVKNYESCFVSFQKINLLCSAVYGNKREVNRWIILKFILK